MLSVKTIKNLSKNEFYPLLKSLGYKNVANLLSGNSFTDYYNTVSFLKNELSKSDALLTTSHLDDFLSYKFLYELNNLHFVFNLSSLLETKQEIEYSQIKHIIESKNFHLNRNLTEVKVDKLNPLCTTRVENYERDGKVFVKNIQFLLFIDEVNTSKGITNLFSCIDINLISNFISIKLNSNVYENIKGNYQIIENILNTLMSNSLFKDLKIVAHGHNQVVSRKTIQHLFINLSKQAENILKNAADSGIQKAAENFLKSIKIPNNEDYIKQIISIVYQNISKSFTKTQFNEGWVFRFVFKEGDNTRASSSTDDFAPVYNKQVYWNLKELMFKNKGTDFIEAGFLWFTKPQSKAPVSVKIEQKNHWLMIQYYKQDHNKRGREEKERFVLQKIRNGIPK
ncbi:hypothetical protein ACQCT3_00915 [Sutcliffiella horikoshii]|uniref:hypothetical protein n=1 Tax=Sutcliffiella horikoshii TaxID=79883 RepID=UPI003CE96285